MNRQPEKVSSRVWMPRLRQFHCGSVGNTEAECQRPIGIKRYLCLNNSIVSQSQLTYCWNCGAQLQRDEAKFCSKCGTSLQSESASRAGELLPSKQEQPASAEDSFERPRTQSAKELGSTLEDNVATIFKRMGYNVELRRRFSTQSGTAEIDILLTRGNRRRAIECKNYGPTRYVGIKELRDFKGRLEQVGIISGLFVTSTSFSGEAEQYADSNGIETWDKSILQEKILAYFTGRDGLQMVETIDALQIVQSFEVASAIQLRNKESVRLFSSLLIYHPYYLVKYRVYGTRKDPTGRVHKIVDEGVCIVDAIDGDVTNRESGIIEGISGLLRSKDERVERKEDKLVTEDLVGGFPDKQAPASTSEYQAKVLRPQISDVVAWKITKEYAIQKNTRTIHYELKTSDDSAFGTLDSRSMSIVPKESEVTRRGQSLIHVPKWDFEYESGQTNFQRRILASSGSTIKDSIAKCEKCSVVHRSTIAVCEICGLPLCEKHVYEEAGALLCENHISNEMRQKLKSNSFMSKVFRKSE